MTPSFIQTEKLHSFAPLTFKQTQKHVRNSVLLPIYFRLRHVVSMKSPAFSLYQIYCFQHLIC